MVTKSKKSNAQDLVNMSNKTGSGKIPVKNRFERLAEKVSEEFTKTGKGKGGKEKVESMLSLGVIEPEGINKVEDVGEWEEINLTVDSGASETLVGDGMVKSVAVTEGAAKRRGVQYEVADGTLLPNLGEQDFVAVGERCEARRIKAQVCDVNKALSSVRRMAELGNKVVFESGGRKGYIESGKTGERTGFREMNGMYVLRMRTERLKIGFWMAGQGMSEQEQDEPIRSSNKQDTAEEIEEMRTEEIKGITEEEI